jgi:hypothetical protein
MRVENRPSVARPVWKIDVRHSVNPYFSLRPTILASLPFTEQRTSVARLGRRLECVIQR